MKQNMRAVFYTGLLSLTMAVAGCASATPEPQARRITYSEPGCFGYCPNFQVSLDEQGQVVFEGRRYVRALGQRTKQVDPARFAVFQGQLQAMHFQGLSKEYGGGPPRCPPAAPDAGGVTVAVDYAAPDIAPKRVYLYLASGCKMTSDTRALLQLMQSLREAAEVDDWSQQLVRDSDRLP